MRHVLFVLFRDLPPRARGVSHVFGGCREWPVERDEIGGDERVRNRKFIRCALEERCSIPLGTVKVLMQRCRKNKEYRGERQACECDITVFSESQLYLK